MSNRANNNKCGVKEGGNIYYDVDSIDVKVDPENTKATNFEALFLASVIDEIEGSCFTIEENCKSQYPLVTQTNSRQWITSIDQDNRVGLAHVMETSKVPILYNTPRLCDPGMKVSKNWSLKNYIETRLYAFKYKYDQGKTLSNRNQNGKDCYKSVYFDFRPFEYKMRLPNPSNKNAKPEEIYITEWITVEPGNDGGLGYTPHMRVSNLSMNKSNTKFQTKNIFTQMIKKVLSTRLGNNEKSIIKNSINIGPFGNKNGQVSNASMDVYIKNFIVFLNKYDGIQFDIARPNGPNTGTQTLTMTDTAISVLYFDLIHDGVFKKKDFGLLKFKKSFKSQFITLSKTKNSPHKDVVEVDFLVGAKMAQKSHKTYGGQTGNILINTWGRGQETGANGRIIKNVPSIFKTLGDLSQFIYAVTYDTVVASGDKMGMAAGLFMTASNNKKLRLMMEDTKTGFVLYTGFPKIDFVSRSTCSSQKGGACSLSNETRRKKSAIVQLIKSTVNNKSIANKILASRPVRPKLDTNMRTFIGANNVALNKNTSQTFFKKVEKFLPYFTDNEFDKVDKILVAIEKRTNPENQNTVLRDLRALRGNIRDARSYPTNTTANNRSTNMTANNRSTNMNANNRTKLSNFINTLNKLTPNNKKEYLNKLNASGSNFNVIKNAAYNVHRVRVFNSYINRAKLTNNQYNSFVRRIKNNDKLQNVVNEAKLKAPRNVSGQGRKRQRTGSN